MNRVTVADKIVEFVAKFCSKKIFVLTGNGAMFLNDAIERSPELEYVCVRNEAVAPMAAAAESQVTGIPGVICVTAGPGSTNAMSGVAEAWVDSAPILVISGQVPSREVTNYGRSKVSNRSFGVAGVPTVSYVREFTKLAVSLEQPENLKEVLQETLFGLRHGRKGPIWLDVPLDIQSAKIDDFSLLDVEMEVGKKLQESQQGELTMGELELIRKILGQSARPLLVLGRGIEEIRDQNELLDAIADSTLPIALSRVVAYKFPLSLNANLGVLGVRGRPWSKEILNSTDLIISLGCRLPSSIVGPNYSYLDSQCKIVMIDLDKDELDRHGSRVELGINRSISNLPYILRQLSSQVTGIHDEWFEKCQLAKNLASTEHLYQDPDQVFNLYWFMKELESFAPKNTVLTTDAGSNYYAGGQAVEFSRFSMEITSGTYAAMGLSIPLAIGSAFESKTKGGIVFCVTGDGSIELNIQELQTLSIYNLPIKIFVINNGGYASMRAWQETYFDSRYIGSTDETGTKPLNFEKIAYAFDLPYERISCPRELPEKMQTILKTPNPQIIEVICDSNQKLMLPMEMDLV